MRSILALLLLAGCASNSGTIVRDLPLNLEPLGRLMDGCEHSPDSNGDVVARCGDLLFRVREVEAEAGTAPRYLGDGVDLANANAGRMVWDTVALSTSVDRGLVDRGQVRAVADEAVVVVLLGASRQTARSGIQQEVSCHTPPSESSRCEALLTAFLDLPPLEQSEPVPAGVASGSIHGRAISLPTTCQVVEQSFEHGRYVCADEARLYWLVTSDMDDAAAQADAALSSLADGEERRSTQCMLLDTQARCEASAGVIVGLGYLDAQPIVVVCVATDPWNHGLCKSSFRRR